MLTPWKRSYDQIGQHIKKQRHYFADKGPSSQSYGFSSSHVWVWELDYKESCTLKNWCFWTVVLEKTLRVSWTARRSNLLVQFSSVAQLCPSLCDPIDCSTPGLPVHHQLPELAQTHVHQVGDAIQPPHPVIPFSSCLQAFPASASFPMSQFFQSNGYSIGVSASAAVLPMNIKDWFPLGWTSWIFLLSKGLSKVFNTTVLKHQFFIAQLSL